MSGKTVKTKGLVVRPAGGAAGRVQRDHPADDGGQLLGAGDLWRQPVLLVGGLKWFEDRSCTPSASRRAWAAGLFTFIILLIEVPLGVAIALAMPRKGFWVPVCLVLMALPLLIPWNVVGAMWNIFALPDIGLLGKTLNSWASTTTSPASRWPPGSP
jgi:ABC-type sugar transport system permease subunit